MFILLSPFSGSPDKRIVNSLKQYFYDPGLVSSFTGIEEAGLLQYYTSFPVSFVPQLKI
jgi:predicted AAA+ superfamily ATPase